LDNVRIIKAYNFFLSYTMEEVVVVVIYVEFIPSNVVLIGCFEVT